MMAWYPEGGIGPIVAPRAARNLFPVSQWLFWKDVRVCPLYRQRLPRCPNMGMAKCIAAYAVMVPREKHAVGYRGRRDRLVPVVDKGRKD